MNRYISFVQLIWKVTIFCLKLVFKGIFLIVLFPIKLAHHSVKSGVDYVFKGTKLNSKQLETIEKVFEYLAYFAWGQNLLPDSIFKSWYTQFTVNYGELLPYMAYISFFLGAVSWLIAFNLKEER